MHRASMHSMHSMHSMCSMQALKRLERLDALHMCRTVVFFRSSVCLLQNTHLNLSTTFETYSTCDMLIMTMHVCAVLWTEVVS